MPRIATTLPFGAKISGTIQPTTDGLVINATITKLPNIEFIKLRMLAKDIFGDVTNYDGTVFLQASCNCVAVAHFNIETSILAVVPLAAEIEISADNHTSGILRELFELALGVRLEQRGEASHVDFDDGDDEDEDWIDEDTGETDERAAPLSDKPRPGDPLQDPLVDRLQDPLRDPLDEN